MISLSDDWIILIVSTISDVVKEIDRLTNGAYMKLVNRWEATKNTATPDWVARKNMFAMRDAHINEARQFERMLDSVDSYTINGQRPLAVGRALVSVNETVTPGGTDPEYVHYCYLKLASPASKYRIECLGKYVDYKPFVSRAIKINQVGYLPNAKKFAYVGAHIYEHGPMKVNAKVFHLCDSATNIPMWQGAVTLRDEDTPIVKSGESATGEFVYELDFSEFSTPGNYYISVPGVGRSWDFKVADDVYGEVFYTCARGLYHQRCGQELSPMRTNWPRLKCHTTPVGESQIVAIHPVGNHGMVKDFNRFDIIGASTDMSKTTADTRGGWHDAADWDRNNGHYTPIFDLLYAYELNPEVHMDGQLNIPESKDGIPDILNEAEWGLRVWAASMNKEGGVAGMVETNTHPSLTAAANYTFSRRTRCDSLLFSAAAAMLSELISPFHPAKGALWATYAKRSYTFGIDPRKSLGSVKMPARKDRGVGAYYEVAWEDREEYLTPLKVHAKLRMHRLTKEAHYLTELKALVAMCRPPFAWPYTYKDYSPWIFYSLTLPEYEPYRPANFLFSYYLRFADSLLYNTNNNPYRAAWDKLSSDFMAWGNTAMCNYSRALLIAYYITKNEKYKTAAIHNFDYALGCNPLGMSWTTGLGKVYPAVLQSDLSTTDGIDDPIPGITIYGPTGGTARAFRLGILEGHKSYMTPVWRRWSAHPRLNTGQCEYTIQETMSATILASALLLSKNWRPDSALLTRKPKSKADLHGYYYLP